MQWQFWIIQTLNSVAFGGLLFLLSSGFSLIFGLMRIPNLAHGAFFMLGAYFGYSLLGARRLISGWWRSSRAWASASSASRWNAWCCAGFPATSRARCWSRSASRSSSPTSACWSGPAIRCRFRRRRSFAGRCSFAGYAFPTYRLVVLGIALVAAVVLYVLMERTRIGAMIRAGVDDMEMARGVGIPVSRLFTLVFLLGATLAGIGGVLGGPILNAYPGLDADMLPLALIVVILGGAGSLLGAFVGSFVVGFLYNFGIALAPDLAYFVLFLPMVLVLVFLPQGLFGRVQL